MSNYVLIEVEIDDEMEKKLNKIGMFIPNESGKQEKKGFGIVQAVGESSKYDKTLVSKKVFFDKWSGDEIEEEGKKFYLVQDDKLLALIS